MKLTEGICSVCYHLMSVLRVQVHKSRFIYTLAYNQHFLRLSWRQLKTMKTKTTSGYVNIFLLAVNIL